MREASPSSATIRSFSDVGYLFRAGLRVLGHLLDFRRARKER